MPVTAKIARKEEPCPDAWLQGTKGAIPSIPQPRHYVALVIELRIYHGRIHLQACMATTRTSFISLTCTSITA